MLKVTFLGLGAMGLPMARRVLGAGLPLTVWNRTPGRASDLVARGAILAPTPRQAAEAGDVIATMLATPAAVDAVATGEDGLAAGLRPGAVWLDFSTVAPEDSRRYAALARASGAAFCDVPVAGSLGPARDGTLTVLAGGEPAALERAEPVLRAVASHVERVGPVGYGSALKLVNNLLFGFALAGIGEALSLADSLGLDLQATARWLLASPATAPYVRTKYDFLAAGGEPAQFALRLAAKDFTLAAGAAKGALPISASVAKAFQEAAASGLGDRDFSFIVAYLLGKVPPPLR